MNKAVLEEKSSFCLLDLSFPSKLDWGYYIVAIAKGASKKIGALLHSMKFLSPELVICLYKSTIRPCIEYCCHIWSGAGKCYLNLLDKLQRCNVMLLFLSYQLLFNYWPIVKMLLVLVSFIDIILVDVLLSFLNWFLFLMFRGTLLDILTGCMTLLLLFLIIGNRSMLMAFFLRRLSFEIVYLVSASLI